MKYGERFTVYVPHAEIDAFERKLDLLAVSRELLSEQGRKRGTPNRSAVLSALVEEAFAKLPEAAMTEAEQEAYLAPFREECRPSDKQVIAAFNAAGGNVTRTARQLGMTYTGALWHVRRLKLNR